MWLRYLESRVLWFCPATDLTGVSTTGKLTTPCKYLQRGKSLTVRSAASRRSLGFTVCCFCFSSWPCTHLNQQVTLQIQIQVRMPTSEKGGTQAAREKEQKKCWSQPFHIACSLKLQMKLALRPRRFARSRWALWRLSAFSLDVRQRSTLQSLRFSGHWPTLTTWHKTNWRCLKAIFMARERQVKAATQCSDASSENLFCDRHHPRCKKSSRRNGRSGARFPTALAHQPSSPSRGHSP